MHVLILNANTNPAMTEHCVVAARAYAPDIQFTGATGRFGSPHIDTRATYAIAAHAALDAYAAETQRYDAIVLACFGDPGFAALKEIADVPVFALAETACRTVGQAGKPFSVVTGGERWVSMLNDALTPYGLTEHLASIRTVDVTGSQILADPDNSIAKLAEACRLAATEDGATSVILGGAGLVGLAPRVQGHVPVPVLDCLTPAIDAARRAMLAPSAPKNATVMPAADPLPGLSPELSALIAADTARTRARR